MKKIKPFIKKHKVLTIIISIVLVLAIVAGCVFGFKGKSSAASYSFIRTTTLQKGTLEDGISATGTVSSANTSKVTTSLNYTVKSVNVSVGDKVSKGDTIITLDTTELEKQIEKEEQNLSKTKAAANSQYKSALNSYNSAKEELSAYASTLSSAKSAYKTAKTPYDNAVSSLKSQQSAYDKALTNYNKAGAAYVKAQAVYNKAVSGYQSGSVSASDLISAANAYMSAVQNCYGGCQVGSVDISDSSSSTGTASMSEQVSSASSSISVTKTANDICSEVISNVSSLTGTTLSTPSGSNTLSKLASKAQALRNAKAACNYDSIESAYNSAKSTYEQAKNTYEQLENAVSQANEQLTQAKSSLENTSSDQLDELKSQLEECSLKAEQDGTVTALNATVGSTCNMDAAATIQDLTSLQVDITIKEADINNASIGQACHITSDASTETLEGTLTQIDPTSSNGSFGATVKITSVSEDIHIGMNASVEIIVSSSENVYQVPIDAVGEENDEKYVYRKTSGEGTDMEFEKVTVTTGNSNDYYIEIYSDELAEGDVVRSSADLNEGIETISSDSDSSSNSGGLFAGLFGGGSGGGPGNMPSGGSMPSGDMPSFDSSSSDRPTPPNMGGGSNG
jgi:RND family efflux transporter MFP subunit